MSEELNVNHRGSASSWAEPVNIDQQLVVPRDTFAPRQDAIAAKARRADLVLATDLDGTFLGGDDGERHRLYKALRMRRDSVLLVYVTGRALESIVPLLSDPLVPSPDIIIADVGATVVDGETLTAVQPIQSDIEARWPGTVAVLEQLDHWPSLVRQDVPQERRCSFEVDPADIDDGLRQRAHEIGCDILFSAGCYLDILPRGVDKGSTLRAVIAHYAIAEEKVVVAGDTLNDLALFDLGLEAICVGAAEPALVTAVAQREHVYCARAHGAGGIHEGLARLGYLPELEGPSLDRRPDGKAQLLMVYHRLPFAETMVDGQLVRQRHKSPNGIIPSLLRFFSDGRAGSWIAWSKQPRRDPDDFEPQVTVDENSYPNLHASRIALSDEDISLFYERFSKEAFWPIIFSFPSKAEFHQPHWDHYVDINRLFAKRTAEQADRGAVVWIHDYNLWMVPGFLRQMRPDLRIAFFHHTAFPAADVFALLPWRSQIVGSLLACDYVGFHIPRYVENFVDVVRAWGPVRRRETASCAPRFVTFGCALGLDEVTTKLEVSGRSIAVGAHPVGVDYQHIERLVKQSKTRTRIAKLESELRGRACIFSAERLDYVKGPLEKLKAFEALLEQHPELHGHVMLVSVITPARAGMGVYDDIRADVERAVGRVNGRFGRLDWTPIRYFYRSLPFEELVAYYAAAHVCWITPLRDGLNLVAKEYVAVQSSLGRPGALVLSEFAGASVELPGAVLTNPYDACSLKDSLYQALGLTEDDRAHRMQRLGDIVRRHDLHSWGDEFLRAAQEGADE